ncbi:MAG TPA: stage V sporulation protein AE [Firmicutes bacterium]|jgi:stage V sporulation protein AE|nr:stage V sporulation protein AE [Bacillota bacterium]
MGNYVTAFLVGGLICALAQLLFDLTTLTPAHVLTLFVVIGGVLSGLGLYEPLVKFAGAGATVPITSFGHQLVQGALRELESHGLVGVLAGIFDLSSAGITAAIIFGFLVALIFEPKG